MTGWIEIIALGGTIASKPELDGKGVTPNLTADDLIDSIPQVRNIATIKTRTFARIPSVEIDLALLFNLVALINNLEAEGATGIVITQGTDTIEETAYILSLLYSGKIPVIVTGAMRHPGMPGSDGPANIVAAITCAASPASHGQGILVVFNDQIHAAQWVQKRHTSSVDAFWSPAPLGWLAEGNPVFRVSCPHGSVISIPKNVSEPFVPILKPGLGEKPVLVKVALDAGAFGIVAELSGGGHCSESWADELASAAASIPVVFSSRTRGGRVLNSTYGQNGAEIDLINRGLIPSVDLDALKSRLLLTLLLMVGQPDRFHEYCILSKETGLCRQ